MRITRVTIPFIVVAFALFGAVARATGIPLYDHVVVVFEENKDYGQIIGSANAPYINNTLLSSYGAANYTNYHAGTHPSEPNYVEWFSGSDQGTVDDSVPANLPFTTPNLGAKLLNSGRTFKAYGEDLPSVGSLVATSGAYAQKHFPSSYWQGTGTNNIPAADNVPFVGNFPTNAAGYAVLPTVSIVVPNLNNDMHNGSVATGDTWLHDNIDGYAQWARTHNSLLIVTWDEDANDGQSNNQLIPTLEVGANLVAGNSSFSMTHYSMLRTLEDMYSLGTSGAGDAAAIANSNTFVPEPASLVIGGVAVSILVCGRSFRRRKLSRAFA